MEGSHYVGCVSNYIYTMAVGCFSLLEKEREIKERWMGLSGLPVSISLLLKGPHSCLYFIHMKFSRAECCDIQTGLKLMTLLLWPPEARNSTPHL